MSDEQGERSKARKNFVRLAEARTNRVLKDLDLLANLSNRSNYSYDEKDARKILTAVKKKVSDVESRFEANMKKRKQSEFKLDE